jgi:hypothetical protein
MPASAFVVALAAGAAVLALWVDVRFPSLAPAGITRRVAASVVAGCLVGLVPIEPTVASLIGLMLPALCFSFLTAFWLLRLLAELRR